MKRRRAVSPYMTAREVAQYLKVHPSTIYRLVRSGKILVFKIGADYRFVRRPIDELMAEQPVRKSRH